MSASISKGKTFRRVRLAGALVLSAFVLGACADTFSYLRTQGYEISQSSLQQVRTGQSKDLVIAVMGSPQTQGTFGEESAFYYVQTKIEQTQFGLKIIKERTVLAVYFDNNDRVKDKAVYTLQDGRLFTTESRRTPSFGQDRTFVEQILASF